jgi:hypothetical protein
MQEFTITSFIISLQMSIAEHFSIKRTDGIYLQNFSAIYLIELDHKKTFFLSFPLLTSIHFNLSRESLQLEIHQLPFINKLTGRYSIPFVLLSNDTDEECTWEDHSRSNPL